MSIGEAAFGIILNLISGVIQQGIDYSTLSFFGRRKVERRIEDAVAEVVEPLLFFLEQEGVPKEKQQRLIEVCVEELNPLTQNPSHLFQGALNGQKIFEDLYIDRALPQTVLEDGLEHVYTMLCPRIAALLCRIPAAVKEWEVEAWIENFQRFDEIAIQLRQIFIRIDKLDKPTDVDDALLSTVRKNLAQKIGFDLDLTGLRADRPISGKFEDFFVHPDIHTPLVGKTQSNRTFYKLTQTNSHQHFRDTSLRAIITAPGGAGKSTWTKWLQRKVVENQFEEIAIRVVLRSYAVESLPSIQNLIREAAGKHFSESLTVERIQQWIDARKLVFILDGFDEVRPYDRDDVYQWLLGLSSAAKTCPVLLTSRPLTTDHLDRLDKEWETCTIQPFTRTQVIEYVNRWHRHTKLLSESERDTNAQGLMSRWQSDPTIAPLTGNPLLLSTLLMVHHLDGSLPHGRSQLYQRYVAGMLGVWDNRRNVTAESVVLSQKDKYHLLQELALKLFFREQDQIDEGEVIPLLTESSRKLGIEYSAKDILKTLQERSGLIVGPGIYSFAHKSIAEYLVSEAVFQGNQFDEVGHRVDRFYLFRNRGDDRWNSVVFLWSGLASTREVEGFIEQCMAEKDWALAYGILLDQYDRLLPPVRKRLLLNVLPNKCRLSKQNSFYISSRPSSKDDSLPISGVALRSISAHSVELHKLFSKAIRDRIISWADCISAEEEVREFLCLAFIATGINDSDWYSALASYSPKALKNSWLFWVAEGLFYETAQENVESLSKAVSQYQKARLDASGLVPFGLFSICLDLSGPLVDSLNKSALEELEEWEVEDHATDLEYRFKPANYQAVYHTISVLNRIYEDHNIQINNDWLVASLDWIHFVDWSSEDICIGDLLEAFISITNSLILQGEIPNDSNSQGAVQYAKDLIEKRNSLQDLTISSTVPAN
ncbi:MAG: NACHT domain-containing protein [Cyanobacteria bacterium P01_D01_bin.56]